MEHLQNSTNVGDSPMPNPTFNNQVNMLALARYGTAAALSASDLYQPGLNYPTLTNANTNAGNSAPLTAFAADQQLARQQLIATQNQLAAIKDNSISVSDEEVLSLAGLSQRSSKKSARPKKPKDMPKRPLSAYNIFFKEERAKILNAIPCPRGYPGPEENPSAEEQTDDRTTCTGDEKEPKRDDAHKRQRLPHGKIGFENLAKTIGQRWKNLPSKEREHYKALADEDTDRYKLEMDKYRDVQAKKRQAEEEEVKRQKAELALQKKEQELILQKEAERIREAQLTMETARKRKVGSIVDCVGAGALAQPNMPGVEPFARSYLKRMKVAPSLDRDQSPAVHSQQKALEANLAANAAAIRANLAAQHQRGLSSPSMLASSLRGLGGNSTLPSGDMFSLNGGGMIGTGTLASGNMLSQNSEQLRELIRQMNGPSYNPYV